MSKITLNGFIATVQGLFSGVLDNDEQAEYFDTSKALKAYLIENNNEYIPRLPGFSEWERLEETTTWYYAYYTPQNDTPKYILYDNTLKRVGILYTTMKVQAVDKIIERWIKQTPKLDNCWLSKKQLRAFDSRPNWKEKGVGLRFRNVLGSSTWKKGDDAPTLSLKAWYGSGTGDDWEKAINPLKEKAALSSVRWQKIIDSNPTITSEWYSHGKITVSYAEDVFEAIQEISSAARYYLESIQTAEKMRDSKICAFELTFKKELNLDAFAECVCGGRSNLKLWMIETESFSDFKRFRGVDMHTWDPIYLDVSNKYAYLTIPKYSCVNAAPRIAAIQSENTVGDATIQFDGVDFFA